MAQDEWDEYRQLVLHELKRLNDCYESLRTKVDQVALDVRETKVRSGVMGALGGAIPVVIGLGIWAIKS